MKLLNMAGEMPSLVPPEDESIRTLYVGGIDARITEQDLRDHFYVHGEIETVRLVPQRACAFVTYTTREGAEKAAEELSNKLVVKGLRLKLLWGKPQAPKPESVNQGDETARAISHGGMLPRSVLSHQQTQQPPPTGSQDQPPHYNYFNIPPVPPVAERSYYPSMDPQRMGSLIPSQDGSAASSSADGKGPAEKQQYQPPPYTGHPPPPGQYQPFYPPYGYAPPPPHQYHQYPPHQSGAPPAGPGAPPAGPGAPQQFYPPVPSGSSQH